MCSNRNVTKGKLANKQRLVGSCSFPSPGLLARSPQFSNLRRWCQLSPPSTDHRPMKPVWPNVTSEVTGLRSSSWTCQQALHHPIVSLWTPWVLVVASDLWNTFPSHSGTAFLPSESLIASLLPRSHPSRIAMRQQLSVRATVCQVEDKENTRRAVLISCCFGRAEHPAFTHRPVLWLPP